MVMVQGALDRERFVRAALPGKRSRSVSFSLSVARPPDFAPCRTTKETLPHRLAQIRLLASAVFFAFLRREPDCVPHHPAHEVVPEDDNLLTEPPDPARVAAESHVGHFREERLEQGGGECGSWQCGGRPGVGRTGDEEEMRDGEEGFEGRKQGCERGKELCARAHTTRTASGSGRIQYGEADAPVYSRIASPLNSHGRLRKFPHRTNSFGTLFSSSIES